MFQPIYKILTIQKIVLSSSRGQGNFQGLEASRPRPRTWKCVLEAKDVLEDSTSDCGPLNDNWVFAICLDIFGKNNSVVFACLVFVQIFNFSNERLNGN